MIANSIDEPLPRGYSVIIPVYNSQDSLPELLELLVGEMRGHGLPFEILMVDDASADDSWACIQELASTYPEVRGSTMSRNFGQHSAILAALRTARYDVSITMDDDLQHLPSEIWKMDAALIPSVDVVYGRAVEEEHGVWRNLSSRAVKGSLGAAVGTDMASKASAFRLFRTAIRGAFADTVDPYVSIDVLLSWSTTRIAAVDVHMDKRRYGTSNYTLRRLGRHAVNMLTGFSVLPLRIVTITGFGFALFGIFVLGFVLVSYAINGGSLPGFPFLASLVAIFSGAQLFALGVLGEYLGRMHFRSMQRPPYVVRASTPERAQAPPTGESAGGDGLV